MIFWITIKTLVGEIALAEQDGRLIRVYMPNPERDATSIEDELGDIDSEVYRQDAPLLDLAESQICEYFNGERTEFELPLEYDGTEFQRSIWQEIARIPFGETLTYTDIAHRINNPKAARAVGNSCGKNPLPLIIPCHRVLAVGNRLGGYSSGLDTKRTLLQHEGVKYQ